MNIILMMNDIKNYYYNNDCVEALKLLEKYFKMNKVIINDKILDIYIRCLIDVLKIDDAKKYMSLMIKMFPGYYNSYMLGIRYCHCRDIDKLREIIEYDDLLELDLYYLGKECYYCQYYDEAIMLFNRFLLISCDEYKKKEVRKILLKIKLYNNYIGIFREENYLNFKLTGKELLPGHVIYVDKVREIDDINKYNDDPKCDKRPYMIWKIDGEKIYCFPITSTINKGYKYVLYSQNYPNIGFDRSVKDTLVCIYNRDVTKVIDRIREEDYKLVLLNIYNSICCGDNIRKKRNQLFVDSVLKDFDINIYDIVSMYDSGLNRNRLYFIIGKDIKNKKYTVIEVKYNDKQEFEVVDYKLDNLRIGDAVLNVIKLDNDSRNKLLESIPTNYKKVNMLGKVVKYDNRDLEIMLEEDKYYLCLDRTDSYLSKDISIYFLRKDVPLFALFCFTDDKYKKHLSDLEKYIKNNYWKYSQEKNNFLVRSKCKK